MNTVDQVLSRFGITQFHEQGYTGKGIKVLIHETDARSTHARNVKAVFQTVAPDAEVEVWDWNGKALMQPGETQEDSYERIIREKYPNYDIINRSFQGSRTDWLYDVTDELAKEGLLIIQSSGNDPDTISRDVWPESVIGVGAVNLAVDDNLYLSSYSGQAKVDVITEGVEFVGLAGIPVNGIVFGGTSCAAPFVSGQMALLMQKYGRGALSRAKELSNQNIYGPYSYLKHGTGDYYIPDWAEEPKTIQEDGLEYAIGYGYIDLRKDTALENTKVIFRNESDRIERHNSDGTIEEFESYAAPRIIDGRMMISLRDLDKLGLEVYWDAVHKQVEVTLKKT